MFFSLCLVEGEKNGPLSHVCNLMLANSLAIFVGDSHRFTLLNECFLPNIRHLFFQGFN